MPDDISPDLTTDATVQGMLHIYVAFDWGDEVDLHRARPLIAASYQTLPRRKRTPSSF